MYKSVIGTCGFTNVVTGPSVNLSVQVSPWSYCWGYANVKVILHVNVPLGPSAVNSYVQASCSDTPLPFTIMVRLYSCNTEQKRLQNDCRCIVIVIRAHGRLLQVNRFLTASFVLESTLLAFDCKEMIPPSQKHRYVTFCAIFQVV